MSSWISTRSRSDSISGTTFTNSLDRCDILIAIVGPRWGTPDDSGNAETDWVRIEIEAALAKKIPVIPVLIDGITLPAPAALPEGLRNLAFRQAAPVDSGRDLHLHMDRLIKAMDKLLQPTPEEAKKVEKREDRSVADNKTARTHPDEEDGDRAEQGRHRRKGEDDRHWDRAEFGPEA